MIRLATSNIFSGEFYSLSNTNFVVLLGFLIFVGFLAYKGVPKLIGGLLDKRADGIRAELDEARKLRDEAQEIFAEYERKIIEVEKEADEIIASAKKAADSHAKDAEVKLSEQVARRVASGKEQIVAAETAVERGIRAKAAQVAVEAARDVLASQIKGKNATSLINDAIQDVGSKLN